MSFVKENYLNCKDFSNGFDNIDYVKHAINNENYKIELCAIIYAFEHNNLELVNFLLKHYNGSFGKVCERSQKNYPNGHEKLREYLNTLIK